MVVCHCYAVNDRQLRSMLEVGTTTFEQIAAMCGAGARCGGCRQHIEEILEDHSASNPLLALRSA